MTQEVFTPSVNRERQAFANQISNGKSLDEVAFIGNHGRMKSAAFLFLFTSLAFCALGQQQQPPAQPLQQPPAAAVEQTPENNQTMALARLLNVYSEEQLLFSLLQASPFGGERSATDLAFILRDIPLEKRNDLKRDWFVFLLKRFTIAEINQMREWQVSTPNSQALVLKLVAQVAVSDTKMLGQLMGMVPNAANVQ